jgi:hypothetical protein
MQQAEAEQRIPGFDADPARGEKLKWRQAT